MLQKNAKRYMFAMIAVAVLAAFCTMIVFAASGSLTLDANSAGLTAEFTGDGTWNGSGKTATGSVEGTTDTCGSNSKNSTLTLKNTSSETKTLSFKFEITSNTGSITIGGTTYTADGSFSKELAAQATVSIVLTSGSGSGQKTSIELSEINLVGNETVSTTFAVAEHGSYTVNGTAITADQAFEQAAAVPYEVVVTADSGYVFFGWQAVGEQGYLSYSDTSLTIAEAATVYPVFIESGLAWFQVVGGNKYYDLNEAINNRGSNTIIYVCKDGTLPSGEYTIPAGVTLLIPYSDSATSYDNLEPTRTQTSGTCTAFRTLTVPADAIINCNGDIRVDACQYTSSNQYTGHVSGPYGYINLSGTINMKSGSNLMAYGYIAGTGTVNAESGSYVYELFQICDWRGGNNSLSLKSSLKNESFLFSQFYIQNIESTFIINHGSTLTVYTTITASIVGQVNQEVTLVAGGSDGLFRTSSGTTLTRTYSYGRVTYTIKGDFSIGSISLTLPVVGTVNSSDYVLNLPSNMSIVVASGTTTLPYSVKLLPGTELRIEEGAEFTMTSGAELILYDYDDWTSGNYARDGKYFAPKYSVGGVISSLPNSPGKLIVNGTLNIGSGAGVYSTNHTNATNGNAALSGTGTIVIDSGAVNSRTAIKEVSGSSTTLVDVAVTRLLATIAGKTNAPTVSMENGTTYYGLGSEHDNRWYVNKFESPATCEVGAFVRYGDKDVTADTATDDNTYKVFTSEALGHDLVSHEAKAPTCDEIGWDAYDTCSRCDYSTYVEKPALGHTPGEAVRENYKAASLDTDGSYDSVVYCTVCGAEISRDNIVLPATAVAEVNGQKFTSVADALEAAPVKGTITILSADADTPAFNKQVTVDKNNFTYDIQCAAGWTAAENENGTWNVTKVTEGGKFHIWASNVNMGNNLDMLFAIPKSAMDDWTGCYAMIERTFAGESSKESELRIELDQWQTLKQGSTEYYVITYGDFSAKEMCDTITLTVYDGNNEAVSYPWTDSIRAYAMRIITSPINAEQAAVAIDMLNFGAEAQNYFGYGVDKLANDLLTDTQKAGSVAKDISDTLLKGDEFAGGYLIVTSHIQYAVGFTDQTEDMTATVTYTDHKGNDHEITGIASELLDGQYGFTIKDCLVVADARCPITITVYNAGDTVYAACQDSVEAYIYRMSQNVASANNVYAAFMKFADSAYAFLHLNDTTEEVVE